MIPARPTPVALLFAALGAGCADSAPREPAASAQTTLASAPDEYFVADTGVRLRYRQTGTGDPVVVLHGLMASLEAVAPLADSLRADHRVIALDLRGHGGSAVPVEPDAYGHEMGEDVIRLLDHLGIARAHLVGHSMGAVVSAYVAARHPERVASISLIAAPFFEDSATAAMTLAPVVAELEGGGGLQAFIDRFIPEMPDSVAAGMSAEMAKSNDRAMLIGVMRTFPELGIGREGARAARTPALVVVGSLDTLRVEDRALASWWPQARLLEVEGADHVAVFAHSATLAAVREQISSPRGR